jgi:hypothetical protein
MVMKIQDLLPGTILDNQQLCGVFGCAPQGGMRRSHKTNTLVLISDHTGIYEDRQEGGIFHYTGMGQKGDQALNAQNKTLAESRTNGVGVHFFEVMRSRQYTYRGEVELAADPYIDRQPDVEDQMRNVWIFPLIVRTNLEEKIDSSLIKEVEQFEEALAQDETITDTEKERMVKTRIGQSKFKQKLINRECKCAICGVSDVQLLIGSHIKPWSNSTNEERLDAHNGLLLCPNHDALFDKGYISFDQNGILHISSQIRQTTQTFMNINPTMRIKASSKMKDYLQWHIDHKLIR